MKKIYFLLPFLLLAYTVSGQQFSWVKTADVAPFDRNVTITGKQDLLATINLLQVNSVQTFPPFQLAVYDTTSQLLWSKNIRSTNMGALGNSFFPAVSIDQNRNIVLAGVYRGSLVIDSTIFSHPASNGILLYVGKFNSSGNLLWIRNSTFLTSQAVSSVNTETDAAGNIYVAGCFNNSLTIGSQTITSSGQRDAFVAKYDPNGNLIWLKKVGTTEDENITKLKVTANGSVFMATTTAFISMLNSAKLFLTKLDSNGNQVWNRTINPAGNSNLDLEADASGNLYLAGNYMHSIDFSNSVSLTSINTYKTFLAKFDSNGNVIWAKDLATGNNYTSKPPVIYYTATHHLAISGSYTGAANFNNKPFTSFPGQSENTFIVKADTAGNLLWTRTVPSAADGRNYCSGITGDANGNLYLAGILQNNAIFSGITYSTKLPGSSQAYITKLDATGGNTVTGKVFLDSNLNGIKDANEPALPGHFISTTTNTLNSFTTKDGTYEMVLPSGNFTLAPAPKLYYTLTPASRTTNFRGNNQEIGNFDFALQPNPNQTDVRVRLTPWRAARPGFNFSYTLTFDNKGTIPVSDTVTLTYDPVLLNFLNCTSTPETHKNGVMKWSFTNLQPMEARAITVHYTLPVTVPLNTALLAKTVIQPITLDRFTADNYDSARVITTGSFDPNDKQVDKPEISPVSAAVGEYLDYTIRFQNTGTDTAFTVVVADKIAEEFQLNTFEMLAASHPYQVRVAKNNTLEWHFNNILLPDSNRNEPGSHGFIRFRIKTKPSLMLGDSVRNKAAIYFDFNEPVITNYAVTKVVDKEMTKNNFKVILYPNPTSNFVTVASFFQKKMAVTVSLVNLLGQTLSKNELPAATHVNYQLPLTNLPKGVYIVQVETEASKQMQRLVIQ